MFSQARSLPTCLFNNIESLKGSILFIISSLQLIGWRKNARHLLLYITDAGFHFAGDGKVCSFLLCSVITHTSKMNCMLNKKKTCTFPNSFMFVFFVQLGGAIIPHTGECLMGQQVNNQPVDYNQYDRLVSSGTLVHCGYCQHCLY